ncbi:MAG TPA: protein translocase subunit SecD [Verrucomicrobiae bacterium]|nr:protein translocase subunit SecD [Verrucomicrobiae bacterium]
MNRNHLWKLLLVIFLTAWAVYEMTPPTARPLIPYFQTRAVNQDATLRGIVERAKAAEAARPDHEYGHLLEAIGTNDISRYFPFYEAKTQTRPTTYILNKLQKEAAGKIKLGIDLAGGTSFLVEMNTNELVSTEIVTVTNSAGQVQTVTNVVNDVDVSSALSQAVEVFWKRVDALGVAEPVIQPQGDNRILIQLPGLSEEVIQDARNRIQKVAFLEFRLVHPQSEQLLSQGVGAPGYQILTQIQVQPDGSKVAERYLVRRRPEIVGGISRADLSRDNLGRPEILFTLEPKAAEKFAQVTRDNVGNLLAIVLDGELQSAPRINSEIPGGRGTISGRYTEQEARTLVSVLENPLKAPVHIISESQVDPTLGSDSVSSGVRAATYGLIGVSIFMLGYYLLAGLVANVALMLNILILMGAMCAINATLTLPGIAGIVLTVGMAVDANVLIFERIREELAAGKSLRGAVSAGYNKAFGTIFDSNLTTLISSIILIFMGTGPVKGFGVTLTIGVGISMFTALVVTRLAFDFLIARNVIRTLPMLQIIRGSNINFMRWAVPAFVASWLLIVAGNGYGIFGRGADVFGVEFSGGETVKMSFDKAHKVDVDRLREAAQSVAGGDVLINYEGDVASGTENLRVTARAFDADGEQAVGEKIFEHLRTTFPEAKFGGESGRPLGIERVGPTMGQEITRTAIIASCLAMFGILIYVAFRYEFSFAVGAVVALVHDVLMTLGCYFLAGRELNATSVAALLTIIGFSINDTIVIFDRVREDLKLGIRGSFVEIMNKALNQTLSRTIITSGTVFISTLCLYLFGGGVINDFAFTFLVGIISGTFSTIYIACFIVLRWHKGQRPSIGNPQMSVQTAAPVVGK